MIKPLEGMVKPKEPPMISPSSINLYLQDPALWVLKHFYGQTSEFNIHAMRGVAIEDGVNDFYENGSDPVEKALESFSEKAFFWSDEDLVQKIEQDIPDWVQQTLLALPTTAEATLQTQEEVRGEYMGVTLRGFIDYTLPDRKIDLKTVTQLPKISTRGVRKGMIESKKKANIRQQTIYNMISGDPVYLLYVTPEDSYMHEVTPEEHEEAMADIDPALEGMKKLLTMDIESVISESVPNWKSMKYSFYWDEPLRKLAMTVWKDYQPKEQEEDEFI